MTRARTRTAAASGRLAALAFLALPLLSACSDSVGPGPDVETQDQVLFIQGTGNDADIYRMNADGTGLENLTDLPARYSELDLSPDGERVVFRSDRSGCYDIWVMRVDGTELTQLTAQARCNYAPHWSPDGSKIAFFSSRDAAQGLSWEAFVMNPDGSGVVNVGDNPSTERDSADDAVHGWSADGRVVLHSNRSGERATYLANPDGSGVEFLMAGYVSPYWSPDGSRIAHVEWGDGESRVHVVRADGTGAVSLSAGGTFDYLSSWSPTPWSPDGTHLAFASDRSGDQDIWVVHADGSGLINVTAHPGPDAFLGWCPDGRILFSSSRTGDAEIYVANADGSGVENLTNLPDTDEGRAVWVPAR